MRVRDFTTTTTNAYVYNRRRRRGGGYTAEGRNRSCYVCACMLGGTRVVNVVNAATALYWFFVFACRSVVVVDKESEFFSSSVDKIFCGGVPPPLVVVVRQPPLPPHHHYLFRRGCLHCLWPLLNDGRYIKIFTEPELMAGKGARTHARIFDTHTMCKQTNVRKTVTENGNEHEKSSI